MLSTISQIKPSTQEAYDLMHDGLLAFTEASRQGMQIDLGYCKKQSKILKAKIKISKKRFMKSETGKIWKKHYRNPNLNSGPQLQSVLYDHLDIPVTKTTDKGNPSVDNEVLEGLVQDIPEIKYLSKIFKYEKIKNTYIDGFIKEQVNGIIHPGFSLHIPRTFRSSSQNPNFQNIPKRDEEAKRICRSAIIPRSGYLLMEADFSGIEVCVSCCYHKDPKMIEYVKHPEINNMHTDMAIQIFKLNQFDKNNKTDKILRSGAKNGFVFPQFYGDYYGNNAVSLATWGNLPTWGRFTKKHGLKLISGETLGEHLINKGIRSYDQFLNHIKKVEEDFWERRFKTYNKWKNYNVKRYYKKGYLQMLTGFTCSGLMSPNDINNYPIQGSAFHCNLKSFIKLNQEIKARGLKSRLIGQIHDSMVLDAHPDEIQTLLSLIKWIATDWLLEEWKWIIVPMEIEAGILDVDANWAGKGHVEVLRAA